MNKCAPTEIGTHGSTVNRLFSYFGNSSSNNSID